MKTSSIRLIAILLIASFFLAACQSLTVNPKNNLSTTAKYQLNSLISTFETDSETAFRAGIQALDVLGYFRTGEIRGEIDTFVFARKVGDEKIVVKITSLSPTQTKVNVRIGLAGNLPESQVILAEIEDLIFN